MHISRKKRMISLLSILCAFLCIAIYFFQKNRTHRLISLTHVFEVKLERAETLKDVQLDSAQLYALSAHALVKDEASLQLEKNKALLTFLEIEFLRSGASETRYKQAEGCENWFRAQKMNHNAFRANLLRLEMKSFLKGADNVWKETDALIEAAKSTKSNAFMARAYYFKMDQRDYTRTWEDDVHILDSARMFAGRAKDSILLGKIRLMSVLPINGKPQAMDSVRRSLKQAIEWNNPELTCLSYEAVGVGIAPSINLDSALFYLRNGIQESERYGSAIFKMKNFLSIINAYLYSTKSDKVISISHEGLKLARNTKSKHSERRILEDISAALLKKDEASKSIVPLMEAVKIAKETNSEQAVLALQLRLQTLLTRTKRFDEADRVYHEMMFFLSKKEYNQPNDLNRASVLYGKGYLEKAKKNYTKALFFYHKSLAYFNKYKVHGIRRFYVEESILETLIKLKSIDRAKEKYAFIKERFPELCAIDFQFFHLEGLLFYSLNQFDQAILSLKLSIEKGKPSALNLHSMSSFTLSKIYEKKGNYIEALRYNKNGQKLKMEVIKKDDALKLERLQSKYELAQKETEIKKLDIDRLQQRNILKSRESSLQSRRLFIIFLTIIVALLISIVIFISRSSKNKLIRKELEKNALEKEREIERIRTEESKRAVDLKNQLFANISHEFRTPLTLIKVPAAELMDNADDTSKHQLEVIQRNADHLLIMVDEILELSLLDTGNSALSKKSFGLSSFIQKIQLNFEPLFKQNSVHLKIDAPSEEFGILADEYRLKMVLNNLLKNAFHHTPKGGEVCLTITLDQTSDVFKLSVFNSGNAIDSNFLPLIFDRYARSKEKEYAGYGIGLSFCKQIVALHGGEIEAENVENGVKISFLIPAKVHEIESSLAEIDSRAVDHGIQIIGDRQHTVLIVEDNLEMRHLLKDILVDHYEILLAVDGEVGIEIAEQHQPDLIISDIMMPKVGGMELTKTLKENFATSHVPIILLTAKSAGHDRISGLETGADDYLTKPFNPKELRVRVRNLIEQREKLRKRFSKNVFLIPEELTSNSLDQAFLLKATEIVESNLDNPDFTVEQFCRKLALNRNSVHQKLKSLTESSASQFIKSIKLKKAATLLADERISIVEVSELSGFNNRQAFNKAFKDQFEMAPSDYRTECLKKNK